MEPVSISPALDSFGDILQQLSANNLWHFIQLLIKNGTKMVIVLQQKSKTTF